MRSGIPDIIYPKKENFWPFNPEDDSAKIIEDGPIRGMTFIFFSWANFNILLPGSATHGYPLSERIPIFFFSVNVFKISLWKLNLLCLFIRKKVA